MFLMSHQYTKQTGPVLVPTSLYSHTRSVHFYASLRGSLYFIDRRCPITPISVYSCVTFDGIQPDHDHDQARRGDVFLSRIMMDLRSPGISILTVEI